MTAVSKRFSNTNIKYCIKLVYVAIAMTQCLSRFQQLNHSEVGNDAVVGISSPFLMFTGI